MNAEAQKRENKARPGREAVPPELLGPQPDLPADYLDGLHKLEEKKKQEATES